MGENSIDFTVRTDLAVEAKEMVVKDEKTNQYPAGIEVEEKKVNDINVTYVTIDEAAEEQLGKKPGNYVTLESKAIRNQDTQMQKKLAGVLADELGYLFELNNIKPNQECLVVGLGNHNVTPDALGPLAMEKIMVTTHLFKLRPETVSEGYRPVSAITPGVMGVTGVETSDVILGIIEKTKPDFVIAIDALASRSIDRINATIQLSDAGIHPGSGVGNKRKELSKDTLDIPVIAVGVPTVVDAVTITSDTIDYLLKHLGREWREKDDPSKSLTPASMTFGERELREEDLPGEEQRRAILGMVGGLQEQEKRQLIGEVLKPLGHNLMVTPKEVDGFIKDMAHTLAAGINGALHQSVEGEDSQSFTR
ncbi:GPR endopeptidase [Thalassobacillus pellis]|uniref:GPR endopeptidase n=1 Tax=Thalassobacillus pellis TaxID=748008 RepID=UPI001961CEEE|nr:GPR endopeptidase [Thalassobacillus pellis]MBM7554707.1 spore protease [Thalassobacillus pellis]